MDSLRRDIDTLIQSHYSGSSNARILTSVQDVASCSSQMKLGKSDVNHVIYTDHFVHGTNRLFVLLPLMFSSMVSHGFIPSDMNISTLVPTPKKTRKSDNYRAIALSSIAGKLLDKIILHKCSNAFLTLDQQFGFKKHHSTTQCTFVVDEVITYYNTNDTCVKAVLDASKAFDRVEYVKLFRLLLKRDLCPLILRCILNMYVKQRNCVKWMNTVTDSVNISN